MKLGNCQSFEPAAYFSNVYPIASGLIVYNSCTFLKKCHQRKNSFSLACNNQGHVVKGTNRDLKIRPPWVPPTLQAGFTHVHPLLTIKQDG